MRKRRPPILGEPEGEALPGEEEVKMAKTFSRILAPTDFSDAARAGVEAAFDMAAEGGEVIVLHVVDDVPLTYGYVGMAIPDPQVVTRLVKGAEQEMEESLPPVPGGLRVTRKVVTGNPSDVIVQMAEEMDLLVMGTHGRSGLKHALIGSVTEKTIRRSPCPVLVIPPTAEDR